jgi:hypothetical protein
MDTPEEVIHGHMNLHTIANVKKLGDALNENEYVIALSGMKVFP